MSIQDFINTCDECCFNLIPNEFIEQAEDGQRYFSVTDAMIKANLAHIVIEDIAQTDNGISFRLRIAGMMTPDGDLVVMKRSARGKKPEGGEDWLKGFRTGRLSITPEMLEERQAADGSIIQPALSQGDIDALLDHAELWEEHKDEMYSNKELARQRLFLTTKGAKGVLRFELEERTNPRPGAEYPVVPGVTRPSWREMHIIGTGVRQQAELGSFNDFDDTHVPTGSARVTRKRKGAATEATEESRPTRVRTRRSSDQATGGFQRSR